MDNIDDFYTLRKAIIQLNKMTYQFPELLDKPFVMIDKTTNDHRTLAWRTCDVNGFTEFTPSGWGMCPAVVVNQVR